MSLLNLATTVCTGLMIGTELAVSAFINPVLFRLQEGAQAQAVRIFAARLGRAMPFWYVLSLLLLVAEAVVLRHAPGAALLDAAVGIWVAVIAMTFLFLVPINNRLARLEAGGFGKEEQREHRKWDSLHRLRVAALVAAMVCFLVAIGV